MADDPADPALHLLRRLDAKTDRVQSTLDDHTGRLQRLEQRSTRIERRVGDIVDQHNDDHDRLRVRLDELERRLRRLEDAAS
jgi:predicted nuclease with TOPRIM domain